MATKKTTKKKTATRKPSTDTAKTARQKKENSKKITDWIFYIAIAFFIFSSYMIWTTQDLSPLEWLADIVKGALMIGIPAYMYRAVMTDKMEVQLKYAEESSKLKKTYGDDYITEQLEAPEFLKHD